MYIGQSKSLRRRFARHKRDCRINPDCNGYISRALNKHGPDAFEFKILVIAPYGDYLNELEQAAIRSFNTMAPHGYNLCAGGRGGSVWSEEARQRLKGRPIWNKGIPRTEEQKRHHSMVMMGKPAHNKGRPISEDQKAKQSAAMKGRTAWNKGVPMSEDQKAKLRLVDKSYTQTPEYRAMMSERTKGRVFSEEHRAKITAALQDRRLQKDLRD